ncbi:hypothetical protein [Methylobacterium sp. SD21]|uniref:hypothetical protein n=1 Tax=Methylobacterium litchii TaxID=3138810 RepID=UPI00313C0C4E
MPAAIGAAILAETALGAVVGTGALAASVVGYAVIGGALLALQAVVEALTPAQKRNDAQVTVRQAIPPRRGGHGREKLGGAIFFLDVQGGVLTRGVVHFAGRLSFIHEFWLGDIHTSLAPQNGGVVPDPVYQGKIAIESYVGTDDQAVSAALSRYGYWSPAARLKGLAYTVVVASPLKHGDKIFPEGAPDVRLVADLSACYDPRDPAQDPANAATWRWSDNAAIVLLDYLHSDSGYGIAFAEIDLDSFVALANVCDEEVPLLRPNPDGDTSEPRYRSWGTYTFDEERATVLARYLSACDAELDQDAQGRVTVHGGRWQEPTFTITEDMVLGWDRYEVGDEAFATFNRVKFTYKSPWHDYQPVEGDPWDDAESQAEIGVVPTERDFGRAPSHSQGRRLAKIAAAKGAPDLQFSGMRLSPAGLPAYGEPTVRLVLPSFGIDATFAPSSGKLTGPFKTEPVFDLYSLDASAYAWSPIEEGNAPPLPDASSPAPAPIPTGVVFEAVRYTTGGQVTGLSASFTADPVAGRADLVLIGRFRPAATDEWADMASQDGAAIAGPLNDGQAYEAQVAWLSSTSIGDWGDTISFTVAADTTPTGPATGFVVNGGVGQASYAFTAPNAPNFSYARLYRSATTNFANAVVVKTFNGAANQAFDGTDARPAGTYSYWVRAFNASGFADASSIVGPITVTVT